MAEVAYKKSTTREYFESLVITVILALFGTTFIVQAFKIPTPSMEDNLLVGDHLLVNKFVFGARGSFSTRPAVQGHQARRRYCVQVSEGSHEALREESHWACLAIV